MTDRERKDRLIQTRVPESLESALKQEATRRRLPVSQLVRNILEDTLHMVGSVVDGVDAIVQDSIELGRQVGQGVARARGRRPTDASATDDPTSADDASATAGVDAAAPGDTAAPAAGATRSPTFNDLADVYAWNEVVPNRASTCARCGAALPAGERAFVGLRDDPTAPRAWSCVECVARL
ncbi:MAG: hypothetical protein IPK74_30825 [Deltaproteobacteria bacterium]|nr:hypothetical protein [Deltaproteobacteria bacterium]